MRSTKFSLELTLILTISTLISSAIDVYLCSPLEILVEFLLKEYPQEGFAQPRLRFV
jgi:hypothetical protein